MKHVYTLHGKFKPYTRRTRQGKKSKRANEYHASQNALRVQFKNQMQLEGWEMLPGQTPLSVHISIEHSGGFHNKDIDNQCKGLIDSAQGVVFPDDRWIDLLLCCREKGDTDRVVFSARPL